MIEHIKKYAVYCFAGALVGVLSNTLGETILGSVLMCAMLVSLEWKLWDGWYKR